MITYSHKLYDVFEPLLGWAERKGTPREPRDGEGHKADAYPVLVFGLGRFGTAIGLRLKKRGVRVLGVDFNPAAVSRWRELGMDAEFGDATDPEFVAELPLPKAEWIVSTVPIHPTGISHEDARSTLIQLTRTAGFSGKVAITSHHGDDTQQMLSSGADMVIEPFQDAADRAVEMLCGAAPEERTSFPEISCEAR